MDKQSGESWLGSNCLVLTLQGRRGALVSSVLALHSPDLGDMRGRTSRLTFCDMMQ